MNEGRFKAYLASKGQLPAKEPKVPAPEQQTEHRQLVEHYKATLFKPKPPLTI